MSPNLDQNFGKNGAIPSKIGSFAFIVSKVVVNKRFSRSGQTYGSAFASSIIGNPQPDLISAGKDGTSGYVKYEDLVGPQPKTPEEAIAMPEMGKFEKR